MVRETSYGIVINLPSRPDRCRDIAAELARIKWPDDRIIWYPGIDPKSSAGFPNAGYRGCFLSHLGALNLARNSDLDEVLMIEDDCGFGPIFPAVRRAAGMDSSWGICYFGHGERCTDQGPLVKWASDRTVILSHCYAVRASVLKRLCAYLEAMLLRPCGHPAGGPMSPDAALNWFRRHHPDLTTLVALPAAAYQRSSRSEITPRWFDRVPGLRATAALVRRMPLSTEHTSYAHAIQWKLSQLGIWLSTEQIAVMSELEINNEIRQHLSTTSE
jgi:hypothetical protein